MMTCNRLRRRSQIFCLEPLCHKRNHSNGTGGTSSSTSQDLLGELTGRKEKEFEERKGIKKEEKRIL